MATVGFLHVAAAHVDMARRLVAERAPWVTDVHLVDRTLLDNTEDVLVRLAARIGELVGRDVDTVVCTCPDLVADTVRLAHRAGIAAVGVDQLVDRSAPALTPALTP